MRKVDKNRCPFCGSTETNIMVPIYASCHTENGRFVAEVYESHLEDVPYIPIAKARGFTGAVDKNSGSLLRIYCKVVLSQ